MSPTGERPVRDHTPASLIALHTAGYRLIDATVGSGAGTDIGCGTGEESAALMRVDRTITGVDYHALTAATAARRLSAAVCADARVLPLATSSQSWVSSSHIIEHFTDPERHVAEIARVLHDEGVAVVLTPNAPADFENPFHVHLFTPDTLREILDAHFDEVEISGLTGNATVSAEFARRRRTGRRLLALDPLGLRHRLPHRALTALHSIGRRLLYPILNRGGAESATADDFIGVDADQIDDDTLVLVGVARHPRR
jgi:SAM-dependent methyltransferase